MFKRKEKGAANLLSYFLYIFVSLAILSTVMFGVQDMMQKNQEKYNFDEMIKNINTIHETINNVSKSRFSAREINIFNPEVLEIDCQENLIKGEITYNQNINEEVEISNILITKETNRLYFNKTLNNNQDINFNCDHLNLYQGKETYVIKYQDYNVLTNEIILSIELLDFNRSEE